MFADRLDAGQRLAAALAGYRDSRPLILAVPRGGVVVAAPVAQSLQADLDIVIARKVGLPGNPELAVAAVAPDGEALFNRSALRAYGLQPADLEDGVRRETAEIARRAAAYRGERPQPRLKGRTVIVIDDGLATGFTVEAALRYIRRGQPERLVLAVPVAPPDTVTRLRPQVDELVCLAQPEPFYAVGQFYQSFEQLEDGEVTAILKGYWSASAATR